MNKPSVFIGSSKESISISYEVQKSLQFSCEPTVWDQGIFELTKSSLQSLFKALDDFEFAIFVFSPDDEVNLRGKKFQAVRDNVVFELGLFLGRRGPDKVFILQPRNIEDFHLPTDLLGITAATYDSERSDGNIAAALGPACSDIMGTINRLTRSKYPEDLLQQYRQMEERYRLKVVKNLKKADKPSGFPMPESLDNLDIFELNDLCDLLLDRDFDAPVLPFMSLSLTVKDVGEASDIEIYKLRSDLEKLDSNLEEWESKD